MKKLILLALFLVLLGVAVAVNTPSSLTSIILSATTTANTTNDNLTLLLTGSDADGDAFKNITEWSVDSAPLTLLNMPFEGGSNATFTKDYSDNGNDGTVFGAVWNSSGGYDGFGAFEFDGLNDFVNLGTDDLGISNGEPYTITAWAKMNSTNPGGGGFFRNEPIISRERNSQLIIKQNTGQVTYGPARSVGVNCRDRWCHIAVVYDGVGVLRPEYSSRVKLYVDGVLRSTAYCDNFCGLNGTFPLVIGRARFDGQYFFRGTLDEVAIWDRNLSSEQVMALYNNRSDLIVSQETIGGETWRACVTPNDGIDDGTRVCSNTLSIASTSICGNSVREELEECDGGDLSSTDACEDFSFASGVLACSGSCTYDTSACVVTNTVPTQSTPTLSSTLGTNTTDENLTVRNVSTSDADADPVKNINRWIDQGRGIKLLDMPFEGGSNTSFTKDYSGNGNDGVVIGASWRHNAGYDGLGAFELDGVNDHINLGTDDLGISNGDPYTITAWAKVSSTNPGGGGFFRNEPIISRERNSQLIIKQNTGQVTYGPARSVGVNCRDRWCHIAVVYDGVGVLRPEYSSRVKLYVDGVLRSTAYCDNFCGLNGTFPLVIGRARFDGQYFFRGTLDEVAIWDRNLSSEQVMALYNNRSDLIVSQETIGGETWGACITPNDGADDGAEVCANNITLVSTSVCGNAVREELEECDGGDLGNTDACEDLGFASGVLACSVGCTYDTSACVVTNTLPTHSTPVLTQNSGNLTVQNISTFDADADAVKNINSWFVNETPLFRLHMPFEGSSTKTFTKDYSGNGNDGVVIGASWRHNAGYDGLGAFEFDGVNDYINLGIDDLGISNGDPYTITAWAKVSSLDPGGGSFKRNEPIISRERKSQLIIKQNTGRVRFGPATAVGVNCRDRWCHVAAAYDGTDVRLYVDGVLETQAICGSFCFINTTDVLVIGRARFDGQYFFRGAIDEVAIWDRNLSSQQVEVLYNNRTDLIVDQETVDGDIWKACIAPNDGAGNGTQLCSNNLTVTAVIDTDGDGFFDDVDNCVIGFNPDQSDLDGQDGGDVCDVCPVDATDTCGTNFTAGVNVNSSGATVTNPEGEVSMSIPSGALDNDTSISLTKGGSNFQILVPGRGGGTVLYEYTLGPPGTTFDAPVTLTFLYDTSAGTPEVYQDTGSGFTSIGFDCTTTPGVCTGTVTSFSNFALIIPTDSDSDGVPDDFDGVEDLCDDTPSGAAVDSSGCSAKQLKQKAIEAYQDLEPVLLGSGTEIGTGMYEDLLNKYLIPAKSGIVNDSYLFVEDVKVFNGTEEIVIPKGTLVFDLQKAAVDALVEEFPTKKINGVLIEDLPAINSEIEEIVQLLVNDSRLLADTLLTDLGTLSLNADAQKEYDKGVEYFNDAPLKDGSPRKPAEQVDFYKKAWEQGTKALEKQGVTGDVASITGSVVREPASSLSGATWFGLISVLSIIALVIISIAAFNTLSKRR